METKIVEVNGYIIKVSSIAMLSPVAPDYPNKEVYRFEVFTEHNGSIVFRGKTKEETVEKRNSIKDLMSK